MSNPDVINLDELKEIMDNDMDLIKECFNDFCIDWDEAFENISKAVNEKNASALDQAAHKLKGTLRYLAADKAQQAAYELELAGKEQNFSKLDVKLNFLEKKGLEVIEFIKNFKG